MTENLLVIGAGHASGQLLSTLKHRGFSGRVTLVGEEHTLPYQRPPLSKKFLSGELSVDRLLFRPAAFYEESGIDVHLGTRIESIDPASGTAVAGDGTRFDFDTLVLATGARPRTLDVPGTHLDAVHYLRNVADVEAIRPELVPGRRLTIVGAGYIGLEVAAVARSMDLQVTVIEFEPRVLNRVVAPPVAAVYEAEHRRHGVELILSAKVTAFHGEGVVDSTRLDDGREIPTDLAIIGIGAVPNTELAEEAGLEIDDGIVVDDRCRTTVPNVFALGDCTFHPNNLLRRSLRLESVHNAVEQAKTAAANLCGETARYDDVPWFWSDQYDMKLQIAGLSQGHDETLLRGNPEDRAFSCLYLRHGRLIAIDAVNTPRDFIDAKSLIAAAAAVDPLRAADPATALRDLA